jgi:hypothetical protein
MTQHKYQNYKSSHNCKANMVPQLTKLIRYSQNGRSLLSLVALRKPSKLQLPSGSHAFLEMGVVFRMFRDGDLEWHIKPTPHPQAHLRWRYPGNWVDDDVEVIPAHAAKSRKA